MAIDIDVKITINLSELVNIRASFLELDNDDLIIAYKDEVIVGSRYWNGELTDIPAIGVDSKGGDMYAGYCEADDIISFKVLDSATGELISMDVEGDVTWTNMAMSIVHLTDPTQIPLEVSLNSAYPNPFNPTTMLSYSVPSDMNVTLSVYNMRGRLMDELVSGIRTGGFHQVVWNADQYASGVYMVKLTTGSTIKVQKIMLLK